MAQVLGIFNSSGAVANSLGRINFGPECFTGDPQARRSLINPSTIWIAVGVDPDAGGIMPDARVYDKKARPLGRSTQHDTGVLPGGTNVIVVDQTPAAGPDEFGHWTLFSGNYDSLGDSSICIAWATIHWQKENTEQGWSGSWGRACEEWGAQWFYSGMVIPGSDNHSPDCLWVYNWDPKGDQPYPEGTDEDNPPIQGFHVNWPDMKVGEDDRRLNTSAQAMCDSRSFRLYKNHDPFQLDLRHGEVDKRPGIVPIPPIPTSSSTTSGTTTTETSSTEQPTTKPTTEPTTEPTTTKSTSKSTTEPDPTTSTAPDPSTTTSSTSQSITTTPSSSSTSGGGWGTTIMVPDPDNKLPKRYPRATAVPPYPRRRQSVPDKFAAVLVINDHEQQTAEALCGSKGSLGPSFADARRRMYCDMETKTLYPFCDGGGNIGRTPVDKACFDFEGSNMLRGPGVQKRQAPRVQDWRLGRRRGHGGP